MTINIQQSYANDTLKSSVKGIFVDFEIKKNQDNRKTALQRSYLIDLEGIWIDNNSIRKYSRRYYSIHGDVSSLVILAIQLKMKNLIRKGTVH